MRSKTGAQCIPESGGRKANKKVKGSNQDIIGRTSEER